MVVHAFRASSNFANYASEGDAYALDLAEIAAFNSYCAQFDYDHISVDTDSCDARCHVTKIYGETYRYDLVKAGI